MIWISMKFVYLLSFAIFLTQLAFRFADNLPISTAVLIPLIYLCLVDVSTRLILTFSNLISKAGPS